MCGHSDYQFSLNPASPGRGGGGGIFIIVLSLGGHFVKQHVDRGPAFLAVFRLTFPRPPGPAKK